MSERGAKRSVRSGATILRLRCRHLVEVLGEGFRESIVASSNRCEPMESEYVDEHDSDQDTSRQQCLHDP